MWLAGKEAMDLFISVSGNKQFKPDSMTEASAGTGQDDKMAVYDGMITVEIPVLEPQVVAYEPVIPPGEEPQIEFISLPGQASNA